MANEQCGCKGIRSCLLCEGNDASSSREGASIKVPLTYDYCNLCETCCPSTEDQRNTESFPPFFIDGILLVKDFISDVEQERIVSQMDQGIWVPSQSGRRKQDFGPKVNFKKRKVKCVDYNGFPIYSHDFIERLTSIPSLTDFRPVELCNLEYCSDRGSAIDPHLDDHWLWGERLVTLNLLSSTTLTLSLPDDDANCDCRVSWCAQRAGARSEICDTVASCGHPRKSEVIFKRAPESPTTNVRDEVVHEMNRVDEQNACFTPEVRIELPARSLLVLSSCARYHWLHGIQRSDVSSRRLAMTVRELSQTFLEGGTEWETGDQLIRLSKLNLALE